MQRALEMLSDHELKEIHVKMESEVNRNNLTKVVAATRNNTWRNRADGHMRTAGQSKREKIDR